MIKKKTVSRSKKKPALSSQDRWAWRFDLITRLLVAWFFAFCAGNYFISAYAQIAANAAKQSFALLLASALSVSAIGLFSLFVAYLYIVRLPKRSRFAGWAPALTALLAAFLSFALLLAKPLPFLPISTKWASVALILIGNSFAFVCLRFLGRSFSILPEGRELVTTGPYRYIRHPLYLAEFLSTFGAFLTFLSPVAAMIVAAQFGFQILRMHYEEEVLRQTFPSYAGYCKRTKRLIPGIY